MAPKKKSPTFEEGLERLESIAGQMERGELPLDELMKLYEEGIKLSGELNRKLDAAAGRMMEVRLEKENEVTIHESDVAQQQSLLDDIVNE